MNDMFSNPKPKALRQHQVRAIDQIKYLLGKGLRRVVCQMPTGAGKTLTAAKIIESALSKGNSVIFTAPAISLIDQTVQAFEDEGITGIGVMQANHPRTDPMARVQVASVQTLARREIPQAALVIVDEVHIRSAAIEQLISDRPDVFFIGLSATPWAKGMGVLWQDLVIPCTIGDLINGGYLSKFVVYAP
ncbi:MAG: DEAD/DEAH box helicase family protein, partial [Rhodobacteraceae bacterium]|nr:DEAD/DEAH box helicase family protein [Paracoccaceae bacterium]